MSNGIDEIITLIDYIDWSEFKDFNTVGASFLGSEEKYKNLVIGFTHIMNTKEE